MSDTAEKTIAAEPEFLPHYALEAVPRYTSYPPATGFHDGLEPTAWRDWMDAACEAPRVSLYLHIPFCKSMCWYCGCNTTIPNRRERITRYLGALQAELKTRAAELPADHRVDHVHFGGGSPDMLEPDEARTLLADIKARFQLTENAEIAFELDPRGVTRELAEALAEGGCNRVSLGVQDLSLEVQELIHRIQPREQVEAAVRILREAGIAKINLDIMYGLPAQTLERVRATASAVAELKADRVAVFGYAHVPWFKKHQKAIPEDRLPGARERFEQMLAAADVLTQAGYDAIGFDHFARPDDEMAIAARRGELRRNFQGFTDDAYDILLGLGASAISETAQGYVQNNPDPTRYAEAISATGGALLRGLERTAADRKIAARIEALMCRDALPLTDLTPEECAALEPLADDGLIEIGKDRLTITTAGRPYTRNIAARLDPRFVAADGRHSRAV